MCASCSIPKQYRAATLVFLISRYLTSINHGLNKFLCCAIQFEGRHLIARNINGCMTHVGSERERACHFGC